MRYIDNFHAILLDMCNTFMFEVDRFSEDEDYFATYRLLGGNDLSENILRSIINELYNALETDYLNPLKYDDFPTVPECLTRLQKADDLPKSEIRLIEQVFARHEVGKISQEYVEVISKLAETHKLGVVSNIWSRSEPYLDEMRRSGVHDLFDCIIMSSDFRSIKPAPTLFLKAMAVLGAEKSATLFVGDSFDFDIAGANHAGLSTVWITSDPSAARPPTPNRIISDLSELLALTD